MALKYSSIGGGTGTGFNVQIGSKYSYATFTSAQPAGAYTIKSSNNYTNWDVYLLDASNNLVAYTGSASIAPTTAFNGICVVNGTVNDILQFSFQSTVFSTATTTQTKAGPFITSFASSSIPNINNAVTVTGGNFAVGITATFTGTDNVVRTCKSVVYTSTTSIAIVRPDVLPIAYAPYTLTLTNPGVSNPTTSNAHLLTGLTVGSAPSWTTAASLPGADPAAAYSTTIVATDPDTGGSITYSYISGSLPTGLSFNSTTGVISGTYSGTTGGTASYTVRATDAGGNYTDRTFTIAYTNMSGGLLSSDATYYYRTFTSNGTLALSASNTVDVLAVAGGGGGGGQRGGGGGAGGAQGTSSQALTAGSYTVSVGAGGAGGPTGSNKGSNGITTNMTGGSLNLTAAVGGGGGGGDSGVPVANGNTGGSGGGSSNYTGVSAAAGTSGQGNAGGTANDTSNYYGAAGGGGAGGVGANGTRNNPGAGGTGTNAYSSWLAAAASSVTSNIGSNVWATATSGGYIAGGGAGGYYGTNTNISASGGAGGGGRSVIPSENSAVGAAGVVNTGGGGGGGVNGVAPYNDQPGGAGASGILIVRYTRASVGG